MAVQRVLCTVFPSFALEAGDRLNQMSHFQFLKDATGNLMGAMGALELAVSSNGRTISYLKSRNKFQIMPIMASLCLKGLSPTQYVPWTIAVGQLKP